MSSSPKPKKSISLRAIHIWLIAGAVLISGLVFFTTYHLSVSFRHLNETSEQQIRLREAARELMDASDYLTENAQRFTVNGDMRYLEAYFNEAFDTNRRENAIVKMSLDDSAKPALKKLQAALTESNKLMKQEYYAMRLVIDAKGYTEYPKPLDEIELSAEDAALSAQEKMNRATELVLGEDYYASKDLIRQNMRSSLAELEKIYANADASYLSFFRKDLIVVRAVIVLQTVGILVMVWLTVRLGIHPILNAVDRIKNNSKIPVRGANEFRYLAHAYNKMYEAYKSSLDRLNFQASHDALTGAYNRSGYDLLLSAIDLSSTYMFLFDLDNFKEINDTYGHEIGDKVLVKLVQVLKDNFRSDDYICRIGGDEFVVFMPRAADINPRQITAKIETINKQLENTDDGLPSVSISVGIAHGSDAADTEILFEESDKALYQSKRRGKRTLTFFKDNP